MHLPIRPPLYIRDGTAKTSYFRYVLPIWCLGQTRLVWRMDPEGWPHSRAGHLCDWPEGGCISIRTPTSWHSRGNVFVDCRILFRSKVNLLLCYYWRAVTLHLECWISCEAEREKYAKLMLLICTDGVAWQSFWFCASTFFLWALGSSSLLQERVYHVPR